MRLFLVLPVDKVMALSFTLYRLLRTLHCCIMGYPVASLNWASPVMQIYMMMINVPLLQLKHSHCRHYFLLEPTARMNRFRFLSIPSLDSNMVNNCNIKHILQKILLQLDTMKKKSTALRTTNNLD